MRAPSRALPAQACTTSTFTPRRRLTATSTSTATPFSTGGACPSSLWCVCEQGEGANGLRLPCCKACADAPFSQTVVRKLSPLPTAQVHTAWGSPGLVAAARNMLSFALGDDKANGFFALLSDSCVPLWPLPQVM